MERSEQGQRARVGTGGARRQGTGRGGLGIHSMAQTVGGDERPELRGQPLSVLGRSVGAARIQRLIAGEQLRVVVTSRGVV